MENKAPKTTPINRKPSRVGSFKKIYPMRNTPRKPSEISKKPSQKSLNELLDSELINSEMRKERILIENVTPLHFTINRPSGDEPAPEEPIQTPNFKKILQVAKPKKSHTKDMAFLSIQLVCVIIVSSIVAIGILEVYFDKVIFATNYKNYCLFIGYSLSIFMSLDLINLIRFQIRYKTVKRATGVAVDVFEEINDQIKVVPCSRIYLYTQIVVALIFEIGLGYALSLILYHVEFNQVTFLLVIIGSSICKLVYVMVGYLLFRYVVLRFISKEKYINDIAELDSILKLKVLFWLVVFKVLPFCQLACSFTGEIIAAKLPNIRLFLLFCFAYPVLMGFWQKLMSIIDEKLELDLEFLGESYSLMYSVLPYRMIYLAIDDYFIIIMVLCIKVLYKTFAYIIVPWWSLRKKQKEIEKKKKEKAKTPQSELSQLNQRFSSETEKEAASGSKSRKEPKIFNSLEPDQPSQPGQPSQPTKQRFSRRLTKLVSQFIDDPSKDDKLFIHKFMVLQNSDIYLNISMILIVISDKRLLKTEKGLTFGKDADFEIRFTVVSLIEVVLDLLMYYFYGLFLKKSLFHGNYNLYSSFMNFFSNLKSHFLLSIIILYLVCYYIRYYTSFVE